ncbi:ABC transporter ATP-binding protein [Amycolatopsis mongoliensis]|uniref:ABC transporter ATP-binding protein n=1 Tax=Amycolatopsis mongoliensis TaxID=715475 RepID=A0A9Y2JNM9_9PSEU|nr:ABC transporter ATP-binding protein [Amycolatopsis sp. 4-36]WIY00771.1 ABC transporter ATP-binding protein [Amycolatopsis sp. 4-36]
MAGEPAIQVEGLTKAYGRTTALREVSFALDPGEVFGYLGPNGAGKTTTLRLLMGMIRPTSGAARVLGMDSWREAVAVHRVVGYVPGETRLYDRLTGRQHVAYFGHLRGDPGEKRATVLAGRLDLDLDRPTRSLSKGNRQKLAVVLALMSEPRVLILDEPSGGLDPLVQHEFHALLREHTTTGGSVLFSSHVLAEVQRVADRIGVLRAGRLVTVDRVDDLRAKSLHHIRARFAEDVPATTFAAVPDVRDVAVAGRVLTCSAPELALDALVKEIARHRLLDFECVEADLEETFLTYYGSGADDAA